MRTSAAAFLVVLAAAVLPFLDTLQAGFLADDYLAISLYRQTPAGVPVARFLIDAILTNARVPTTFYRPLAFASVWVETRVWGPSAWPFHLTNLLLHACVCLLMVALVRQLTRSPTGGDRGTRAAGSLIPVTLAIVHFAAYPRRVEPVAWISCRPDLLATLFAVAAAIAYAQAVDRADRVNLPGIMTGWIAPGLWFGSLLCKESAMLLPIALAFIPLRPGEGQSRSRWVMFAPFAVAAAVYLVLRRAALGMWIGGYGADRLSPSPRTLAGTMRHVAYLLVPPLEMIDRGSWIAVAAGVAALLLLVALARYARPLWNTPLVRVGAAWIVVTILPIAALPVSLVTTFNDRLLYLPGIGMACVLAGVLSCIGGRVLLTIGGTAALVLCVWTATIAHRWQIAGALSENLIRQLAASLTGDEQEIYLASVPDSYGGAYMLRSAIPEALQLTGLQHVPRVIVLTRYFVQRPDRLAVTLAVDRMRTGATHVSVRGRDSAPTLLLEDLPPSAGIHRAMLPRLGTDAFDRYLSVEADVPRNSRVLLVGPTRILDEWPPH